MRALQVCSLITAIIIVNATPVPRNLVNLDQIGNDLPNKASTTKENAQDVGNKVQHGAAPMMEDGGSRPGSLGELMVGLQDGYSGSTVGDEYIRLVDTKPRSKEFSNPFDLAVVDGMTPEALSRLFGLHGDGQKKSPNSSGSTGSLSEGNPAEPLARRDLEWFDRLGKSYALGKEIEKQSEYLQDVLRNPDRLVTDIPKRAWEAKDQVLKSPGTVAGTTIGAVAGGAAGGLLFKDSDAAIAGAAIGGYAGNKAGDEVWESGVIQYGVGQLGENIQNAGNGVRKLGQGAYRGAQKETSRLMRIMRGPEDNKRTPH